MSLTLNKTKIVVRNLPPEMTQEELLSATKCPQNTISYLDFIPGKVEKKKTGTAILNFMSLANLKIFLQELTSQTFTSTNKLDYRAEVDYAISTRIFQSPRETSGRGSATKAKSINEHLVDSITKDPDYMQFMEKLQQPIIPRSLEQRLLEEKEETGAKVTPLVQFLNERHKSGLTMAVVNRRTRKSHRKSTVSVPVAPKKSREKGTTERKKNRREKRREQKKKAEAERPATGAIKSTRSSRRKRESRALGTRESTTPHSTSSSSLSATSSPFPATGTQKVVILKRATDSAGPSVSPATVKPITILTKKTATNTTTAAASTLSNPVQKSNNSRSSAKEPRSHKSGRGHSSGSPSAQSPSAMSASPASSSRSSKTSTRRQHFSSGSSASKPAPQYQAKKE